MLNEEPAQSQDLQMMGMLLPLGIEKGKSVMPVPHYVMPDGGFIKLRGDTGTEWVAHACELIAKFGKRDERGFTTCQEYTNIQCTCQRGASEGNSTCARFFRFLDAGGV